MSLNNAEGACRGTSSSPTPDTEASQLGKLQKAIGYARAQLRLKDEENAQLKDDNKAQELELQLLRSELAKSRQKKNEGRPSSRSLQEKDMNEGKRNSAALNFLDALSKATEPQKRRRSKHSSDDLPDPKAPKPTKVVQCVKCYIHGWKCDEDEPCRNCCLRKKNTNCRRMRCQHYASGTCQDATCLFAHEGDGYTYLNAYRKLHQDRLGMVELGALDIDTTSDEDDEQGGVKL